MAHNLQNKIQELELRVKQFEEENKVLRISVKNSQKNNSQSILKRLKESEERYILSQTIAQIGSWAKSFNDNKLWVSDEMLNLLGIAKESNFIHFDQILAMVHNDDRHKLESAMSELAARNKKFDIDLRVTKPFKDEKELRYIQFVGAVLKDENDDPVKLIGVIKDITDCKKNIKELKKAKEKAENSDKLKTSFLSNMSHDLRTPMNAIIGYSELLNLANSNPPKRKEYSKIIKQKGLQLLTLIDDIIEVSKFETGVSEISKTNFNIHELLAEIKNNFIDKKVELGKDNVDLRLALPMDMTNQNIFTDPGRLQQVIGNLIENALKYTEKGYVEFGYEIHEEGKLQFYVKDTGKGISKDNQKNIFNRFKNNDKTANIKYSGSGLGLTVSKRVIDLLGGKIWLTSEENNGAVFYFTIPIEQPEGTEPIEAISDNSEPSNQNWKDKVILIVEDEEVNYKFLETVLHDTQAQVLYAKDGFQAIDLVMSINKIDMILMDIKMPEMDGFEAAKRIKQIRSDIPIIAQTAFASRDDRMNSYKSGCDDYLTKPIEIELLISKINKFFMDKELY